VKKRFSANIMIEQSHQVISMHVILNHLDLHYRTKGYIQSWFWSKC